MKSILSFFSLSLTTLMFVACVSSESEMLKQARSIQDGIINDVVVLDSTMTVRLGELNAVRSEMSMDTTLSSDSVKMKDFMIAKEKIDNLSNMQSELTDWRANMKMLPSVQDMDKGSENPFGEKAKDQEILNEIKKSRESFNNMKLKAEAAMK